MWIMCIKPVMKNSIFFLKNALKFFLKSLANETQLFPFPRNLNFSTTFLQLVLCTLKIPKNLKFRIICKTHFAISTLT